MKKRYPFLDLLRGIAVVNMIIYHALWDLVYIYGIDIPFYKALPGRIWQQCICHSFILLSGFCISLGKNSYKRGLKVFLASILVSAVTILIMPENKIIFGILTFLGASMLICRLIYPLLIKIKPYIGLALSLTLFLLTRNINNGYLGFSGKLVLPDFLYNGYIMTFLGFTDEDFFSTDYFSLFPWLFLFLVGFYFFCVLKSTKVLSLTEKSLCTSLEFIGKQSLIIYLAHQPVIYLIFIIIFGGTQQ